MYNSKSRNDKVDIIRGIAILMVVLGHTISTTTTHYEQNWLFRMIWSLQMPLFFILSGYITKYARSIESAKDVGNYIVRKICAYIFPWIVWTFFVRALLMGQTVFFDIPYFLYHMDIGYWFLISLFTVNLIYGIAIFLSQKLAKQKIKRILLFMLFFMIGTGILFILGSVLGMNFLSIKLTLYYIPFFLGGWLYGQFDDDILNKAKGKRILDIIIAVSFVVYLFGMWRVNIYALRESLLEISLRISISVAGCIAICGFIGNRPVKEGKINQALLFCGKHSLEIYLSHNIFLSLIKFDEVMGISSLSGAVGCFLAYICILVLAITFIALINSNKVLRKFLFWK